LGFDPKIFDPIKKNSSVGFRKAVKAAWKKGINI
jgi:hypothetical protein